MVYCKKCARLLDEDVRFCPYCNHEDEHFAEKVTGADEEDVLQALDAQIAEQASPVTHGTTAASDLPIMPPPLPDTKSDNPTHVSGAVYGAVKVSPDDKPSTGLYVGMILLAVFLSVGGLIAGIIYMTNKNPEYKKMGTVVLIVSLVSLFLSALCCCASAYISYTIS